MDGMKGDPVSKNIVITFLDPVIFHENCIIILNFLFLEMLDIISIRFQTILRLLLL